MSIPGKIPGLNFQLGEDIDALRDAGRGQVAHQRDHRFLRFSQRHAIPSAGLQLSTRCRRRAQSAKLGPSRRS